MTILSEDAPLIIIRPLNDGTGHYAAYKSTRSRRPVDSFTAPVESLCRQWNRAGYRTRIKSAIPAK